MAKETNKIAEFDYNAYMKEKVPFRAFRDNDKYKDDIVVSVNGKVFTIQRGVDVMIPRYVKEVIQNGSIQDEETARYIERETSSFINATKNI